MAFVFDLITLINLIFCLSVVLLSIWWHRESKSRTPLYIGVAFGLFAVSHTAFLLGLKTSLEEVLIVDRIAAYLLVFIGLFFTARDAINRQKAEKEASKKSEELHAAYEQMAATADELKRNYYELQRSQTTLEQARKKLNLLNSVTFNDIKNAIFSLSGYLELEKMEQNDQKDLSYLNKEIAIVRSIEESLDFAKHYQDLGIKPPSWQNVEQTFFMGISHLDLSGINRSLEVRGLEVYADPMLENVFYTLTENVLIHGKNATGIFLTYTKNTDGLVLVFEDDGVGIEDKQKKRIFERRYENKRGMGLFLVSECLSVTSISIKETGIVGKGARFEMHVPEGGYRFSQDAGQ
jgi:signal transduction histidine kinase